MTDNLLLMFRMQAETSPMWHVEILDSILPAKALFDQVQESNPFLSYGFWEALEQNQVIGRAAGWQISYLLVYHQDQAVAWMPLFVKNNNRGEYVFDHAWADAYARYGFNYYPRLVSAIPFTPVSCAKVLLKPDYSLEAIWPILFDAIQHVAKSTQASSWHGLFVEADLLALAEDNEQLMSRTGCQFLWTNQGYDVFDDFLAKLTAKKRKSIRVEREKVAKQQVSCHIIEGVEISLAQWHFFYQCYANTYYERGQRPYLNIDFFIQLGQTIPQHLMLIVAEQVDEPVAAALFFKDHQTLYGRYWGAVRGIDCLHFEVCYYQGVDYAITNKLQYFDPGTQGEHKLIRGFAPVYTHSVHWIAHEEFRFAINDFCDQEKKSIEAYYQAALNSTPFKQSEQ